MSKYEVGIVMIEHSKLDQYIKHASNGSELEREKLIRHYKPYLINVVGKICKRYITWNDDESSIGLMALNKAIDTYQPDQGRSFLNYVYLIVKRDLIDYFKKEEKETFLSLNKEDEQNGVLEINSSIEQYEKKQENEELVEEILALNSQLMKFGIAFEELEKYAPKHVDTREMLTAMASTFVKHQECVEELFQKKQFPMKTFTTITNYRAKTIERHRKYLITLIIIHIHPEWTYLSQYIVSHDREEGLR